MSINSKYGRSELQIAKEQFIWTIDHFSHCAHFMEKGAFLTSPIFTTIDVDGNEQQWQMKMYPTGIDDERGRECLYVYANPSEVMDSHLHVNLQFAIKNSKGEDMDMDDKRLILNYNSFGNFMGRDALFHPENGLLPDDKLTIVCKIEYRKWVNISSDMPMISVPENQLMAEIGIGTLFEKMNFADCTITIISADNKELTASKFILASHSPVFAAMFEHGTIESQNNTIIIPDFDENVLKQMLLYMYNENAVKFTNIEDKLLAVADKYELKRLKALCERELAHSMAVDNACELLILATTHSANQLKLYAIAYIQKHKKQVKASDGWELLKKVGIDDGKEEI